jgi:hypothetical protein
MLGDLMERTSLAEALDKLNSDVAAQHAAGLDALKTWLQVLGILESSGIIGGILRLKWVWVIMGQNPVISAVDQR